jgi:hypothetical protein
MALRKRYKDRIESPDKDGPPVSIPPKPDVPSMTSAADVPTSPAPDAPKPPETTEPSPAEQAGHAEMLKRLREMERAETLQKSEPTQQQGPQLAREPKPQMPSAEDIIERSALPSRAKTWMRQHPDFVTDPAKNALLQKMHNVAEWQSGGSNSQIRIFKKWMYF